MNWYRYIRPLVFCLDAELAHKSAVWALKNGLVASSSIHDDARLQMEVAGLTFKNPVGMAAGFDKNAEVINGLASQGFGFVEAGTVTPRAQEGNPKPRLFRLEQDQAVLNRMGFNNDGADIFAKNVQRRKKNDTLLGINIGKNKTTEDAVADYLFLLKRFYSLSDYITVNISSPNTPGLRALQQGDALEELLSDLMKARKILQKKHQKNVPLFLKIAPDITASERKSIASVVVKNKIDGLIVSNTTVGERHSLNSAYAHEAGGLSGKPLFMLSTEILREMYRLTEGKVPLIGVGGIANAEDAYAKIRAGASLVQLYSALVYQGFGLVKEINQGLSYLLERDGFKHLRDAVGVDAN